jgi:L-ascorbate metabolism protein UlaG (beta-lactamase superfamily)
MSTSITLLGQSGCRIEAGGLVVYVDPYLSHSVEVLDGPDLKRLTPIPMQPAQVTDAQWVLITHEHIDHCDPHTLPELAAASPQAQFVAPAAVLDILAGWGIAPARLHAAEKAWLPLSPSVSIHATPAAHPAIEFDDSGRLKRVGFVLQADERRIYIAGDTSVCDELMAALQVLAPIHTAVLPVNEHNYFRGRRGIIGNMSIREAFGVASELGVQHLIPVHWDMFAVNSVDPDEIRAVYRQVQPGFELLLAPAQTTLRV